MLPRIGCNFHIQIDRHMNSAESENAPYISVTSHHMKTNTGSTPRFSGTGNVLVALFLSYKVKVTPWINVIGHCQLPANENMPYLSDLS